MNDVKFVHYRSDYVDGTIAVVVPTKEYLTQIFTTHSNQAFIKTGVTKLHTKEQFVRKVGRERSSERLKFEVGTLDRIEVLGTRHVYTFTFKTDVLNLNSYELQFGTTAESENVHLLGGTLNENY